MTRIMTVEERTENASGTKFELRRQTPIYPDDTLRVFIAYGEALPQWIVGSQVTVTMEVK